MRTPSENFIGIFDSGFGGITILRGIVQELPEYNYLYLGDTARTPYGTRSQEVVCAFTRQATDFLFAHHCELVIYACNTASSEALGRMQQEYLPQVYPDKKVLGVLIPAAEEAIARTRNKKIGVIATEGTVESAAFRRELTKLDSAVEVYQQACPLLVPIVEAGEENSPATKLFLEGYLVPLVEKGIDTLILGCTHYGILEERIREVVGSEIAIISEAAVVPGRLRSYLTRHPEIEGKLGKGEKVRFFSTDLTDKFTRLGSRFFEKAIHAEKVELR